MDERKATIASNLIKLRLAAGMTQAELGEKLNYSDKSISKWERGESVPDVLTLVQLADLFEIPVNQLLEDPNALPGNPGKLEKAIGSSIAGFSPQAAREA